MKPKDISPISVSIIRFRPTKVVLWLGAILVLVGSVSGSEVCYGGSSRTQSDRGPRSLDTGGDVIPAVRILLICFHENSVPSVRFRG